MVVVVVAAVVAVVCNYGPIQRTGAVVGKGGQVWKVAFCEYK